jgi:hypothetical protein
VLFGSYRRGDANDPDAYVAAIAAVLSLYDADLMREVTDPRTGICTNEKYMSFMPNAGELRVYCEGLAARKERMQRLGSLPPVVPIHARLAAPQPAPGDKATVFVPISNLYYPKFVEWAKTADPRLWRYETRPGIWVSYDAWDARQTALAPRPKVDLSRTALSEATLRTMASVDAERHGHLPVDQIATEAAE